MALLAANILIRTIFQGQDRQVDRLAGTSKQPIREVAVVLIERRINPELSATIMLMMLFLKKFVVDFCSVQSK
ncbi:MAG: hypothetical protein ACPG77_19320, partial [Nannocystaceae bacterium]